MRILKRELLLLAVTLGLVTSIAGLVPDDLGASFADAKVPRAERFAALHGDGELSLHNIKTGEHLQAIYRDAAGDYDYAVLSELNRLLRCSWDDETTLIDLELVELLDDIQDHFGVDRLDVVSGYRSPAYNEYLASLGRHVAKKSFHMKGLASDIQLPGVPVAAVRDYARELQLGGVGYYPADGFVHVDVGPVRTW